MPGTFSDSWRLTKTAFRLIVEDRALLVFPLVAGLSILGVLALLLVGEYFVVVQAATPDYWIGLALFLAAYFAMSFLSVYATGALIGAATLKLNGQQPTASDGWKIARSRLTRLAVWSVLTATVGLAIQAIARRMGGVGGLIIGAAAGASWAVVTYFMIPVLLYENQGAWRGLARSGHLFVSTFGRTIVTNLVIGLIIAAGLVGAVILGAVGFVEILSGARLLGFVLLGGAIALGVVVALIGAAVEGILRAALYRFATTGQIDPALLPAGYAATPGAAPPAPLP